MAATATAAPAYASGFVTLADETEVGSLPVEGSLPPWLAGSLLRTGPSQFEAGDRSVAHWFDGLAMLHRYSFADGEVAYANRFLHSRAWRAVQETGELQYSEFATDPCRSLFRRVASMFKPALSDNGAVNVSRVGDEYLAMTETPLPVVFDPETLEAAGVAYEPPGMLTTAHPHNDPERHELLNFTAHLGPRSQYRFYGQRSRTEQRVIASAPVRHPAYVHSFGLSERYLILAVGPFTVDPLRLATSGRPYIENYRWNADDPARFLVFDRNTGDLQGTYETDPFFVFHHINAYERGGELVVDLCAFEDASIIDALYLERLRAGGRIPLPQARRYVLGLDSGSVSMQPLSGVDFELPRINYRAHNTKPYRYAYGASAGSEDTFLGRIAKLDVESGESWLWAQDGCFAGEPVFVPEPGAEAEDAGVLLSVVLDTNRDTSFLLVLDAATLDERARAEVPHRIPLAFHGQFFNG